MESGGTVGMKKSRLLLAAAAAGLWLSGCSGQKAAFSPSESCVYVTEDGSLSSALVEDTGGADIDEKDLRQYLEAAVIRFNQEKGAEASAENVSGRERLPAALQSVTKEGNTIRAIFDYASLEDLIEFRQTEDNEDTSSTVTSLEVLPIADAVSAGWFDGAVLVKADGSEASAEEIAAEQEGTAAAIEGGGTIMFSGEILYMSGETEKKDAYTAAVPAEGRALVVFK